MWWWLTLTYVTGALTTTRILVLWAVDDKQRRYDKCSKCTKSTWCDNCTGKNQGNSACVFLGALWWPIPLAYIVCKKLIFPRGIRTRYAKEKKAAAKQKQLEKDLVDQETTLRSWCEKEGIPWSVLEMAIKGDGQRG